MPLTHVEFADGRVLTKEEALEHAATRQDESELTYELLAAMLDARQERGDRISTTTLTSKCLRSEFLKRTVPYTEPLSRMWASFRGTMFHGQLEKFAHPRTVAEARYWAKVKVPGLGTKELSGSPDLVDPVKGILYDYKFTKENPRWNSPWKDHIEQLQINRWLVDHAYKVELRDGTEVRPVTEGLYRPYEWQELVVIYMDDKGPKPLPIMRSDTVIGKNGNPKKVRVSDIWDDETVEELIRDRYREAYMALKRGEVPEVPEGWEEASHVLCSYCPVRKECLAMQHEGGDNGKEAEA